MPKITAPVPGELSPAGHPYSRCDHADCGEVDDHPKHVVQFPPEEVHGRDVFHPLDTDEDGWVRFHHDCEHEYTGSADPRTVEAAKSGVHGDQLRALIHANHAGDQAAASKGGE
jgi:hypothetical protein